MQKSKSSRISSSGFTLIELLVVISIIALLSSIVLASLASARDKAQIAAAEAFETGTYQALGVNAAALYDFEDGPSSSVRDTSGNKNDGTISGSPTWTSVGTYGSGSVYAMNFTGTDYFTPSKGFGISNTNFTIALWIKTTSAATQMYVVANAGGGNGYRFGLSGGKIAFLIGNNNALYNENLCGTKTLNDGKWHYIAGVFNRSNLIINCYADGALDGSSALSSSYSGMADNPPQIGRGICCTNFVGLLDDVHIYGSNLAGIAVESIYNKQKNKYVAFRE